MDSSPSKPSATGDKAKKPRAMTVLEMVMRSARDKAKKPKRTRATTVLEMAMRSAAAVKTPASAPSLAPAAPPALLPGEKPPESTVAELEQCGRCCKRLKLCGRYECRCGSSFCTAHRLPETHECSYDFKAAGAAALAKANPVVVASKPEGLRKGSH